MPIRMANLKVTSFFMDRRFINTSSFVIIDCIDLKNFQILGIRMFVSPKYNSRTEALPCPFEVA